MRRGWLAREGRQPAAVRAARWGQIAPGLRDRLALVANGWRVLFTRTSDLVQKLQLARRELVLEAAIRVWSAITCSSLTTSLRHQGPGGNLGLFELISARYERRSMLITANQPFGEWGKIFPDPAMTLAAVDRLVHHATIFEMNVESYRRREALGRKKHAVQDDPPTTPRPRMSER